MSKNTLQALIQGLRDAVSTDFNGPLTSETNARRANNPPGTRYWWETDDNARVQRANVLQKAGKFHDIELPAQKRK